MNIFVSGLNFSMSSDELSEVFAAYGAVTSAKVVTDRATGRSRGFGFVEMAGEEEARNAISALDQTEQKGRKINVKEAEDRPQRSSNDRPRGNFGGSGGGRREGGFKPRFERGDRDSYDRGNSY
ncbi:MAG: RNA recognition motif domain-containing protein [Flavobacteriales bacterium]